MKTVVRQYTLIAPEHRVYTFIPLPGGVEVVIRFTGPRNSTKTIVPTQEARDLWKRLRRKGYERW